MILTKLDEQIIKLEMDYGYIPSKKNMSIQELNEDFKNFIEYLKKEKLLKKELLNEDFTKVFYEV